MKKSRLSLKSPFIRKCFHLFNKSGCFLVGIEHVLVILPSALLLAKYANTESGPIITLPMILCSCGIVTLLFSFILKPRLPFFLGPSISYIAFLSYQASSVSQGCSIEHVRLAVLLAYLMAGVLLLLFSQIYRIKAVRNAMHTLFPYTVMGPAISLIGLQVVGTAVSDSGLNGNDRITICLAIVTLFFIIGISLTGIRLFKNASVFTGVLIGCIVSSYFERLDLSAFSFQGIHIPLFQLFPSEYPLLHELSLFSCSELIMLLLSILPPSIVIFLELHGRIMVFEGMLRRDDITALEGYDVSRVNDGFRQRILTKHASANFLSVLIGSTPCTIYAQNMVVMNLHNTDLFSKEIEDGDIDFVKECYNPFSRYPYRIAAVLCILASFFTGIQSLIYLIPLPVFGGMELFLFGLIAAPGIQVLVEEQVNYKKISNQIITASVLIAGIGDISLNIGSYEFNGMSLGLFVGLFVNCLSLFLKRIGRLNEDMTLTEIFDICMDSCKGGSPKVKFTFDAGKPSIGPKCMKPQEWKDFIRKNNISKELRHVKSIEINYTDPETRVVLYNLGKRKEMRIRLQEDIRIELYDDYRENCHFYPKMAAEEICIELNECITNRLLKKILANRI